MLILLSPSKTMDFDSAPLAIERENTPTQPQFLADSKQLIAEMRTKSVDDIKQLMGISDKLAELNHQRFADFTTPFTPDNARASIFAFKGDVYDGLNIEQFDNAALQRAQSQLRMLSGLYGLLRPLDLMQAYRLEMGKKIANPRGKNLYEFWGDRITDALNAELETHSDKTVINLASNEYFKAVKPKQLNGQLVTPIFKEQKGNDFKIIALFAKRARGMMARHLLQSAQSTTRSTLESFTETGYEYDATSSTETEVIFLRRENKLA